MQKWDGQESTLVRELCDGKLILVRWAVVGPPLGARGTRKREAGVEITHKPWFKYQPKGCPTLDRHIALVTSTVRAAGKTAYSEPKAPSKWEECSRCP